MRLVNFAAALLLAATLALPAAACIVPQGSEAMRQEALHRINQERGRAGLTALRPSPALDQAAQRHACDNAAHNRMSHTGSDGSRLRDRIRRVGYSFRRANENVALGFNDAASVVAAWMHSPGHRQNVLDRGTQETGLGLARGNDGRLHWVMVSGRR
jgi:uncharacterized protein YkwD